MTDEKVKAAAEVLSDYADALDAEASEKGFFEPSDVSLAIRALQAERDKLAGEVERLNRWAEQRTLKLETEWDLSRHRADTLEAKLTALVEALGPFAAIYAEARRDFHDGSKRPDLDLSKEAWGFNNVTVKWADFHRAAQALAHHSAPVVDQRRSDAAREAFRAGWYVNAAMGRDAEYLANCESADWLEHLAGRDHNLPPSAPPSTPTSAPVEDVGGRVFAAVYPHLSALASLGEVKSAISVALIQPQGEERS